MTILKHLVNGDFGAALLDFIKDGEGFIENVYIDTNTTLIPTIGWGFALAFGKPGEMVVRGDLDAALLAAGITMSSAQKAYLSTYVDQINDIKNAADSVVPPVTPDYSPAKNDFNDEKSSGVFLGYSISQPQAEALITYGLQENLEAIRSRHPDFEIVEGSLAESNELIAIYSVAYNIPDLVGEGLVDALADGDRARAWFEILYHHENHDDEGLMNRRESEADKFELLNSNATLADKLHELNTLFNGTSHSGANIYAVIQQRDLHKPFEAKIASIMAEIEAVYSGGFDIDYIQYVDGVWINTGGEITAKTAAGKTEETTNNLIIGSSLAETLNGLGGGDCLYGGDGNDKLHGGGRCVYPSDIAADGSRCGGRASTVRPGGNDGP